jgi:hypothetical protein
MCFTPILLFVEEAHPIKNETLDGRIQSEIRRRPLAANY